MTHRTHRRPRRILAPAIALLATTAVSAGPALAACPSESYFEKSVPDQRVPPADQWRVACSDNPEREGEFWCRTHKVQKLENVPSNMKGWFGHIYIYFGRMFIADELPPKVFAAVEFALEDGPQPQPIKDVVIPYVQKNRSGRPPINTVLDDTKLAGGFLTTIFERIEGTFPYSKQNGRPDFCHDIADGGSYCIAHIADGSAFVAPLTRGGADNAAVGLRGSTKAINAALDMANKCANGSLD